MITLPSLLQWFTHKLLGAAPLLYITGVVSVLVYAYFEPQDQGYLIGRIDRLTQAKECP